MTEKARSLTKRLMSSFYGVIWKERPDADGKLNRLLINSPAFSTF